MKSNELLKTEWKEHIQNILKAWIQAIPVIWWPLWSLMSDYLPDYKYKRLINFINNLSEKIEKTDIKIEEEYIKSEEFWYLFEKILKNVSIEYRKEKLEIYKDLLLNFCIKTNINADEKEYILSIINDLERIHVIVFSAFINDKILESWGYVNTISWVLNPIFRNLWIEEVLWKSALKDLENKWIIKSTYENINTMLSRRPLLTERITDLWNRIKNLILL